MASEINNYISDMFVEMASRIRKLESKVAKLEADNYASKNSLSMSEAKEYLGISTSTLYEILSQAQLKTYKIGSRRLVLKSELDKFIEDNSKELSKSKK